MEEGIDDDDLIQNTGEILCQIGERRSKNNALS